ncbi:PAS domain-containing sensor histidine kinase [Shewanella sp. UCD-KL12]|uniref:sensor histidine kinase n=1 Tax=Shewanella sp. UCD-KL12 TaxID=1917163 RepID=UPI0009711E29|nr:ATP-binding protein [Shewanella sp. UCD-KL12]
MALSSYFSLQHLSLRVKLILGAVLASQVGTGLSLFLLDKLVHPQTFVGTSSFIFVIIFMLAGITACSFSLLATKTLATSLTALEVGLLNFKDNDFSVTIPVCGDSQLRALTTLFNESAETLRKERQYIYQRELLLDKVIQSSPNVMLLLDDEQRVIYANDAARHMFYQGNRIDGFSLSELLVSVSDELASALKKPKGGLFTLSVEGQEEDETWHLSRGQFLLNGQYHHLVLLRQMTHELNRQEVAVWKKVIRIISHELNNSVAPIASMVNSGRIITKDLEDKKLEMIFDTIEDRTSHLSQFISNYARFAKLPQPKKVTVDWHKLIEQLAQHYQFELIGTVPDEDGEFDLIQMEQVLLNLLKNAHESGTVPSGVSLTIESLTVLNGKATEKNSEGRTIEGTVIEIRDEGAGMPPEVLKQALLPFYSTKQSGTGLGLPLCREIIEAHEGRISLHNRDEIGLCVRVFLPH